MASDNRGGKRDGAGRKPGSPNKATLEARKTLIQLARGYSENSMKVLHDIAMDKKQTGAARVSAAIAILDRSYGKPQTTMEVAGIDGGPIETQDVSVVELVRKMAFILHQAGKQQDQRQLLQNPKETLIKE